MELILILLVGVIVLGFGPVLAILDYLSRELATEQEGEIDLRRLGVGLLLLWLPLAWIVYFVFIRRRPPFA